jgi:hypothetical protein
MNRRLVRWILALYPRYWRDRYGTEVTSLNEELINAGETTPLRAGLNLFAGAAIERGRALAGSRQAVLASTFAALIAIAGIAFGLSNTRPASTGASSVSLACASAAVPGPAFLLLGPWWTAKASALAIKSGGAVTVTITPGQRRNVSVSIPAKVRQLVLRGRRKQAKAPAECKVPGRALPAAMAAALAARAAKPSFLPAVLKGSPPAQAKLSWRNAQSVTKP